jgi:hypothetical protein
MAAVADEEYCRIADGDLLPKKSFNNYGSLALSRLQPLSTTGNLRPGNAKEHKQLLFAFLVAFPTLLSDQHHRQKYRLARFTEFGDTVNRLCESLRRFTETLDLQGALMNSTKDLEKFNQFPNLLT